MKEKIINMKTANKSSSDKYHKTKPETVDHERQEGKETNAMKESLMLPCTASGKTTSASIAERSNVWAENRLTEKKSELDKKLYKNLVKLNSNRLEIVDELAKLKKSSSTGSLDKLAKHRGNGQLNGLTSLQHSKTVSSSTASSRRGSTDFTDSSFKYSDVKKRNSDTLLSLKESAAKISIIVGGDASSDEASDEEKQGHGSCQGQHHKLSHTACPHGRECSAIRSELQKFENATRRYTHQLSKPKNGK